MLYLGFFEQSKLEPKISAAIRAKRCGATPERFARFGVGVQGQ